MKILGFDWDKGNREKCQKHGLTMEEVESLFHHTGLFITFDHKHSGYEQRFIAVGRTKNGKPASVAFTIRRGYIRPINARPMHEKEIRKYKKIHSAFKDGSRGGSIP